MCTVQHEPPSRTARDEDREFVEEMTGHTRAALLSLVSVTGVVTKIVDGYVDDRMTYDERTYWFDRMKRELLDLFVVVTKLDDEIRYVHDEILPPKWIAKAPAPPSADRLRADLAQIDEVLLAGDTKRGKKSRSLARVLEKLRAARARIIEQLAKETS